MTPGTGVLLIWNDVAPGFEATFRAWHDDEHIPERMRVPGFTHGRRLFSPHAMPRWLTLYEAESPAVFSSPAYRARLDAPTPRTAAILPRFRLSERMAGRVAAVAGDGRGEVVTTFRLWLTEGGIGGPGDLSALLAALADNASVTRAAIVVADAAGTGVATTEKALRPDDRPFPGAALVVETPGDCPPAWAGLAAELAGAGRFAADCYRAEFALSALA